MKAVFTIDEARELDHKLAQEHKLSEEKLIDSAAEGAYLAVRSRIRGKCVVLAGPGNNGSDGIAFASLMLRDGFDVSVLYLSQKGNDENLRRRRAFAGKIADSPEGFDTVVDALFGFGISSRDSSYKELLARIDEDAFVIALDIPSGFSVKADVTVTFMCPKAELYLPSLRGKAGEIIIFNPGFPESGLTSSDIMLLSDEDSRLSPIGIAEYKKTRGHVLAIGGSERFPGAILLASLSAYKAGAGYVSVLTSDKGFFLQHPSFVPASDDFTSASSIIIGPGLEDGSAFERACESGKPLVIDAGALRYVPGHKLGYRAVLTPHIGEYRALMEALSIPAGLDSPEALRSSISALSRTVEAVIVLKAASVWIATGERICIYDGANPSIGVAGSGDVLSGIIGALLARESPERAAIDGVILHQRAGRKAHEALGYYTAEELISEAGKLR